MPQSHPTYFLPPTDILDLSDRLVVLVEIAGISPADIGVALFKARLVISGKRQPPHYESPTYHQMEINRGEFRVEVKLPWQIDDSAVIARYNDGFLRIELPRQTHLTEMNPHKRDE